MPLISNASQRLLRRTLVLPAIMQQKNYYHLKLQTMNLALPLTENYYSAYPVTVAGYTQSADERKIRKVFENLAEAWNNRDAKLFASYFTEDSDYVTFRGDHLQGRKNNEDIHADLFKTFPKNTSLSGEVRKIRFIDTNTAIVHCRGSVRSIWSAGTSKSKLNTNVLVKENGEWKITAFHNSVIKKPGILESIFSFFMK